MKIKFDLDNRVVETMERVSDTFDQLVDLLAENPNNVKEVLRVLSDTLGELTKIVKKGFRMEYQEKTPLFFHQC